MRAVVTGANGFIGQHLCRCFEREGWDVRAALRADVAPDRIDATLAGATVVLHAAGATRAPTDAALWESNVELTRRVAQAAARAGVQRFLLVSSQAASGPATRRDMPVTEADAPAPVEAYGRSKLAAEQAARDAAPGIVTIVRPAAVYGPADRDFLSLFRLARLGLALHPGNRDQMISIIHVSDVVDAILCAATSPAAANAVYFLANDDAVTWDDCFRLAAQSAGRSLAVDVEVPRAFVSLAALIGDLLGRLTGRPPLFCSHKVALAAPRYWICSNELAKRELGFTPRISLEQGFTDTYTWYLENHRI